MRKTYVAFKDLLHLQKIAVNVGNSFLSCLYEDLRVSRVNRLIVRSYNQLIFVIKFKRN